MLSNEVSGALAAIDAAFDTLFTLDLSGLSARELLGVAARFEKAHRRNTVLRHDLSHELHQRAVAEIGGSAASGAGRLAAHQPG